MAQVVADAPPLAHARGRDDDRAVLDPVERHRLLDALGEAHADALAPGPQGLLRILIQPLVILEGEARGLRRHRRIDVHLKILRNAAILGQLVQHVDHLLGAADGKGWHDHIAALLEQGVVDRVRELFAGGIERLVQPVAIGGLDQQDVGLLDRGRVVHQRATGLAEVAREHQLGGRPRLIHPHFEDGRAEDVTGVAELDPYLRMGMQGRIVGITVQTLQTRMGLGHGVERGDVLPAAGLRPAPVSRLPFGLFLLQVSRVR